MDPIQTYRKPYIRPVTSSWWLSHKAYVKYIVRESTSLMALFVILEILSMIVIAILYPETASLLISDFVQLPAIIIANIISLIAVLYHTVKWFNLMPKAVRLFRSTNPDETRLIPAHFWILLLSFITVIASVIIFCILFLAS